MAEDGEEHSHQSTQVMWGGGGEWGRDVSGGSHIGQLPILVVAAHPNSGKLVFGHTW